MALRARRAGRSPLVRPGRRRRRPGLPVPQRRRPAGRALRAGLRSRTCCGDRALSRIGWWPALACAAGFVVVAAPWLLRQLDVFGSLSPSSAGGRILFIREYRELYSVSSRDDARRRSWHRGPWPLVGSRVEGLLGRRPHLRDHAAARRPGARAAGGCLAASARRGLRALARLRGRALRVQRARLGRPRALRHVPPFGGGARAARLPALHGRGRRHRGLGRRASTVLGCATRDPGLQRHGRGRRPRRLSGGDRHDGARLAARAGGSRGQCSRRSRCAAPTGRRRHEPGRGRLPLSRRLAGHRHAGRSAAGRRGGAAPLRRPLAGPRARPPHGRACAPSSPACEQPGLALGAARQRAWRTG